MAKQTINIGSAELAGDGESLRSAFDKINDNFDELYLKDTSDFDGQFFRSSLAVGNEIDVLRAIKFATPLVILLHLRGLCQRFCAF